MKNLLRLKINGKPIVKFCLSKSKQDFYCYTPPIIQDDYAIESHLSFQTKNGRTTFKTTSIRKGHEEMLPDILDEAKKHPMWDGAVTPKDLDIFKGIFMTFEDNLSFHSWFRMAFDLQSSDIYKHFGQSKTHDSDFQSVFDIKLVPSKNAQITINSFIGKNVQTIPDKKDREYDLSFAVTETNFLDDIYTFIFCLSYDFPDIYKK